MPFYYGKGDTEGSNSNFDVSYMPNVGGDPLQIDILLCEKDTSEPLSDKNFRSQVKNYGFKNLLRMPNGKAVLLNNWGLFYAFRDANVRDGDRILVTHVGTKDWKVEVLEKGIITKPEEGVVIASWEELNANKQPELAVLPETEVGSVIEEVATAKVTETPKKEKVKKPTKVAEVAKTELDTSEASGAIDIDSVF